MEFKLNADAVTQDDLVAFANAGGGTILVGVQETTGLDGTQIGKIVGCDASDRERSKIASRARDCRPPVPIAIVLEAYGKRTIMRVEIEPGGLHCTANGS